MNITDQLTQIINQALDELGLETTADIHLEHPADTSHGDFSTNVAMVLFGQIKVAEIKNPRDLAQAIVSKIQSGKNTENQSKYISKISVAGPGFINFYLSDEFLIREMLELVSSERAVGSSFFESRITDHGSRKKVVVEYSSPNIAKPFTIGHLRSTIIGDAIANLFEKVGYEVYRDNHLGDWGTQFGKQIYAIKTWGNETELDMSDRPVKKLVELYVKFHEEAEKDPTIEDEGRAWFKKLEDGDLEARRLWEKCINWSWKEFNQIYQRLGITFTENGGRGYGESFFENKMGAVVDELEDKDLLTESKGARLVFFPDDKYPPMMIIKKDGTTLYATRDLATDKFRLSHYGDDVMIVNEVGAEQSLYFQQLFEIEKMLGWIDDGQRVHVGHGLYRFKDKKMSTRKGNVIWLEDVLLEAFQRVQKQAKNDLTDESIWKIAIGALKWNDLRRESSRNITFDFDEMLNLQGNSGPYLQYTYVRGVGVLNKFKVQSSKFKDSNNQQLTANNSDTNQPFDTLLNIKDNFDYSPNEDEKDVLRNLYTYNEILEKSVSGFAPHHLCTYLYSLAQSFNSFYSKHPIVENQFRVALTMAVMNVIKDGLGLLGIEVVERM